MTMSSGPRETGRVEFLSHGYILQCDEDAIEIHVTDYHVAPLRLTWRDLLALATLSQAPALPGGSEH